MGFHTRFVPPPLKSTHEFVEQLPLEESCGTGEMRYHTRSHKDGHSYPPCWSTLPKFGMFHGVYQLEGPRPRVGYRQGHETGCFYPLRTRMHHTHAGYALE